LLFSVIFFVEKIMQSDLYLIEQINLKEINRNATDTGKEVCVISIDPAYPASNSLLRKKCKTLERNSGVLLAGSFAAHNRVLH